MEELNEELMKMTSSNSLPFVFINQKYIGSYSEISKMISKNFSKFQSLFELSSNINLNSDNVPVDII